MLENEKDCRTPSSPEDGVGTARVHFSCSFLVEKSCSVCNCSCEPHSVQRRRRRRSVFQGDYPATARCSSFPPTDRDLMEVSIYEGIHALPLKSMAFEEREAFGSCS